MHRTATLNHFGKAQGFDQVESASVFVVLMHLNLGGVYDHVFLENIMKNKSKH